jgi:hypothetical protein
MDKKMKRRNIIICSGVNESSATPIIAVITLGAWFRFSLAAILSTQNMTTTRDYVVASVSESKKMP